MGYLRTAMAALVLFLAGLGPAWASFGDCNQTSYLGRFDERLASDTGFLCTERMRVAVHTADGIRHIRIVTPLLADWAVSDAVLGEFEHGVRAAAEAMNALGNFHLSDTTVLLSDGFPPHESNAETFGEIAAWTDFNRGPECYVTAFLLGRGATTSLAASVIAHELFHCVQVGSLSPEQMASGAGGTGVGGDWWLEGSADWFEALALAVPGTLPPAVRQFNERSPDTPLYRMAYSAVPFFLWLGQTRGADAVLPFLRHMAWRRGAVAQRAAMAGALGPDQWLQFAEAYLDNRIRHPHGTALPFAPRDGAEWSWTATRTQSAPLEPFVLTRAQMSFACGRWRTSAAPGRAHAVKDGGGGRWGPLPAEIDTASGGGGSYRFVGMNGTTARIALRIEGRMESGCGDCAGSHTLDRCLVGSWTQTGGGAVAWMRAQMPRNFSARLNTTPVMTLRADGTYATGVVNGETHAEFHSRSGVSRAHGIGHAQASGRWSTKDGKLNLCPDSTRASGHTTITTPDRTMTMPMMVPPGHGSQSLDYTCSGASLETVLHFPGGDVPPMPTQYSRSSERP